MITLSLHLSCGRSQSATKSCFSYILQSTSSPYRKLLHSTFPYHNYYKVLVQQSTSPLLQCVTPVQYCKVLLQNYSAPLQSTTPELFRTTLYCSVPQSTTPALVCTTECYSILQGTAPLYGTPYYEVLQYHKVPLQHTSVPESTTPVLILAQQSTSPYYPALPGTTRCHYSNNTMHRRIPALRTTKSYPVLHIITRYYTALLQ